MRPDQVPQAAVDAAAVEVGRALSPFYGRPTAEDALITRRAVAAAAPHLIDDAMVERAARQMFGLPFDDDPPTRDEMAEARRVLGAALGDEHDE